MKLRNVIANIALGFLLLVSFFCRVEAVPYGRTSDVGQAATTGARTQDLVFVGTVTKIYLEPTINSQRNWVVVTDIDKMVSGEFSGKTFSFMVHSPSLMGLQVGRAYTIKANRSEEGYLVDDTQRLMPVAVRPRASKNH